MAMRLLSSPRSVAVEMIKLLDSAFTQGDLIDQFTAENPQAGAIVTMSGKVRATANGEAVKTLRIDHYPGVTSEQITIETDKAKTRFSLTGALVIHRVGDILPGETIVLVATAAIHRREAFEGCDYLMDYLKSQAYFWKKETTDKNARWIEPHARDYNDAARWRDKQ